MKVDGGCLCGKIAYEAEIDEERVAIWRCRDCQVNAGTAFGLVAGVRENRRKWTDSQTQLLRGLRYANSRTGG
jgi:hypothetical protein